MQKLLKIVAVIAILIAVPKIIQKVMFSDSKADISKKMTSLVNQINQDLPKKIDNVTTLTKAEWDGKTYRINYTMDSGISLDPSKKEAITSAAVQQICGSKLKAILEKGIVMEYLYSFNPDGSGVQTMSIPIPSNSCS